MKHTPVSIVIPNWNGEDLLKKHLSRVIDAAPNIEIIISDDKSTDGSVKYIRQTFPSVKIVEGKERKGFASNVNRGVREAKGEIIILLNTDVEPEKSFLDPLLLHFGNPKVFAVGCLEKSQESGQVVLRGRGLAHWYRGFFVHSRGEVDKKDTAWVSGGSGAFRKSIWDSLCGMDTLFNPFYWEDIDLSYRARKAGFSIAFEPKSIVKHFHEEGKIMKGYTENQVKQIAYRNQFTFIWKNSSDASVMMAHAVWLPIRLIQALFRGDMGMIIGFIRALSRMPMILACRAKQSHSYRVYDRTLDIID